LYYFLYYHTAKTTPIPLACKLCMRYAREELRNCMSVSVGIVGLPNVGKSTLFETLTSRQVSAQNYPFCTIDPNVGTVAVPDPRVDKLAHLSQSAEVKPTTMEFIDIAGLVRGAHEGEGLGNAFLANIREVDAICQVLREFPDESVMHVETRVNPLGDAGIINTELLLADLQQIERSLENIEKKAKQGDKWAVDTREVLQRLYQAVAAEVPIRDLELTQQEKDLIKSYNFLTEKPMMYVVNTDESYETSLTADQLGGKVIPLSIKSEAELSTLPPEERTEYLELLGRSHSGLDIVIEEGYNLLDLISFFTTGPKETRAWTVPEGTHAPQAAGVIHSDFERGFIGAEVAPFEQFIEAGGEGPAREQGIMRLEGKNYVMKDGDVCVFRANT